MGRVGVMGKAGCWMGHWDGCKVSVTVCVDAGLRARLSCGVWGMLLAAASALDMEFDHHRST